MKGDQHPAEYAAPEIDADGDCGHQNGDPSGLLKFRRDGEDVVEGDGEEQTGGDDGQTYPQPYPERAGNRLAGLLRDRPGLFPLETKRVTAPRNPRSSRFM